MSKFVLYESNPFTRAAMQQALKRFAFGDVSVVEDPENTTQMTLKISDEDEARENDIFQKPVRLGVVLDRLQWHLKKQDQKEEQIINLGSHVLDLTASTLQKAGSDEPIKLTDKEKYILRYLYKNKERTVERNELLEEVWGYAANVETHTLETHIYRLRQKIEDDPTKPDILLTKDQGYILGV